MKATASINQSKSALSTCIWKDSKDLCCAVQTELSISGFLQRYRSKCMGHVFILECCHTHSLFSKAGLTNVHIWNPLKMVQLISSTMFLATDTLPRKCANFP